MSKNDVKFKWEASVSRNLARYWEEFVDCRKRMLSEGPFLRELIDQYEHPQVLDAAMGIGCETIWLAGQGIQVLGNEVEQDLREVAEKRASDEGVTLETCSADWRCLSRGLRQRQFDVVLLLGNSLSLLRDLRDRKATARELFRVCKPGGRVVVDERNFRYILSNQEEILAGRFRYQHRVIYCGKSVVGRPIQIADDCVRFGYSRGGEGIGTLDMHPFSSGELVSLFLEAGFANAAMFSDFESGYSETADFYTYCFW